MSRHLEPLKHSLSDDILLNINDYQYMERLLSIMGPNHQVFKKRMGIVHLCIYSDNINIVKMVLDEGGDPNLKDDVGITPTYLCNLLKKPTYFNLLMMYGGIKIF